MIDSIVKKIEFLPSIFFKDRQDRFDYGRSFQNIDESDLIMVNLFLRAKRSNDRISNPANWYYDQGWEFDHGFFDWIVSFCDQKIDSIKKKIESIPSIFLRIEGINLLTVDLF